MRGEMAIQSICKRVAQAKLWKNLDGIGDEADRFFGPRGLQSTAAIHTRPKSLFSCRTQHLITAIFEKEKSTYAFHSLRRNCLTIPELSDTF